MDLLMNRFASALASFALVFTLSACSGSHDETSTGLEPPPTLELTYSESPIPLPGIAAQFAQDVAYGEGERNQFDIFLPQSDAPTPLVIFIHGGSFTGGDKQSLYGQEARVQEFLQRGIAVATINYYLLTVEPPDTDGVIRSLNDSKRAVQFMRYHAASLNIDPDSIAVYGVSAGAGTALWLGTHDDMAEPGSADPVLRQSTRISAMGALATQATYDLLDWELVLAKAIEPLAGVLGGTDLVTIAEAVGQTNLLLAFFAIPSVDALETPDTQAYRANIDMLELMDAGDAPMFVANTTPTEGIVNIMFHHGLHGLALKQRADFVGLASVVYVDDPDPETAVTDPSGEDLEDFLIRHIQ